MAVLLPDGTYVDEEEYAEMIAQSGGTGIPTSGTVLGTNYNFMPTTSGGGALSLGWDQTPGFGAAINFDPSAGLENAFISDYDVSGQGMANVGTGGSSSTLGLTAGLQGTGLNRPNAYMDATISDVVPGLTVGAGTDTTPFASYFGDESSKIPGLGITKTSGGPTDVSYATEVVPGVDFNIGTAGGGNIGVKASGTWDDIGKTFRQLFSPISKAGADASVPEIAVAPSMSGVDYSQALADVGIEPTTAGMAEVYNPQTEPTIEYGDWGTVFSPEDSMATEELDSDEIVKTPSGWMDLNVDVNAPTYDPMQHLDTIYGTITQPSISPVTGEYLHLRDLAKIAPQVLRDIALNIKDTAKKADEQASGKPIGKVQEDIQDVVNNIIGWDARKAGIDIRDAVKSGVHPTVVTDPKQFTAMAKLMQSGDASLEDSAMELASQVDTFKELSAPTSKPSRLGPTGPTHVPAQPALPAYSGPTRAELKAAAVAQRKADLAAQKAAAAATRELTRLRNLQTAQDKARQKQDAANRAAAKAAAKALLAKAKSSDKGGYSDREINAAIEIAHEIDTFGSGGQVDRMGPAGGYGGEGPGGRSHGGGYHGR